MTTHTPSGDIPQPNRLALIPVLAVPLVLAGYGLSFGALSAFDDRRGSTGVFVAASSMFACLLTLALLPMARRTVGTRASYAVALALAAQGLLPLMSAGVKLADPLIASHWRCGTGDVALVLIGPMVAAGAGVMAALVSRFALPRVGVRGAAVLRGLSTLTLAGALVTVLIGAVTVARRPQAQAYLDALPEAGVLPAIVTMPMAAPRIDDVGGTLVWRECSEHGCSVSLRAPIHTSESLSWGQINVAPAALHAQVDRRANLVILREEGENGRRVAFDLRTKNPVDVTWSSLADVVAPPINWFACGALGLLLALAVFARSGSQLRSLEAWRSARPATLSDEGTVRFDEDLPAAKVQGISAVTAGPVLVRGDTSAAHLREMSTVPADSLRAGTLAELEAAISVTQSGRYVLAATVAGWMALPLALAIRFISPR